MKLEASAENMVERICVFCCCKEGEGNLGFRTNHDYCLLTQK